MTFGGKDVGLCFISLLFLFFLGGFYTGSNYFFNRTFSKARSKSLLVFPHKKSSHQTIFKKKNSLD